jgi:hypothetical protein
MAITASTTLTGQLAYERAWICMRPEPGTAEARSAPDVLPLSRRRPRSRRRGRRLAAALLILLALGGVAGGGTGLYLELTRGATRAEAAAAGRAEIASRWRRLPSGKIFPATVHYLSAAGFSATARRVGIAPAAPCAVALDAAVARVFNRQGCLGVLRATYVDTSGVEASTVGIAVLPSAAAAASAAKEFAPKLRHAGVKAAAFPGTVTRLFKDAQRVWFDATAAGPYVFFSTAGYTNDPYGGRPATLTTFSGLGTGLSAQETTVLTKAGNPCQREDIRC